jgi:peptidoglycan/LPS O-acetylase OafA/YrhL
MPPQADAPRTHPAKPRAEQIYGLDVIRFASAFAVMAYHLAFLTWAAPTLHGTARAAAVAPLRPFGPWIGTGWIGVQIFFVISGFVIAYTANGRSPLAFLNSRILRLWPAMLICSTIDIPILFWAGTSPGTVLAQYARSLVFWPLPTWTSSSYWTLPIEIFFYAIIFLLLRRNAFVRVERLGIALGLLCAATWILYFLPFVVPVGSGIERLLMLPGKNKYAQLLLFQHGCFFALGLSIWLVLVDGWTARRALLMALFGLTGLFQILSETLKANDWNGFASNPAVPIAIWLIAMALLAASIVWRSAIAQRVGMLAAPIRAMGLATYPLYLIHQPIGEQVVWRMSEAGFSPLFALFAAFAAAILLAFFVSEVAEPWLRHRLAPLLTALEDRAPGGLTRLREATTPYRETRRPPIRTPAHIAAESPP